MFHLRDTTGTVEELKVFSKLLLFGFLGARFAPASRK